MKQQLYAIVVAGLSRDNLVFGIGPYKQYIYERKAVAKAALRAGVAEQVKARASYSVERGTDPAEALREARRHWRGVWRVATFERKAD